MYIVYNSRILRMLIQTIGLNKHSFCLNLLVGTDKLIGTSVCECDVV